MSKTSRKKTGGAMPGAGRKPDAEPRHRVALFLTYPQHAEFKRLGGSPWLQGLLNLKIRSQEADAPKNQGTPIHTTTESAA